MVPTNSQSANNLNITVGSSNTAVLAANSGRKALIFTNNADEDIYISFGADAVSGQGLLVGADHPPVIIGPELNFTGAINAICSSGSKSLSVVEFV